jgi:ElaB/YqjD/DUF883 family membrane-anchored ribosome-binding protein
MNVNNWDKESVTTDLSTAGRLGSGVQDESVMDRAKKTVVDKLRDVSGMLHQQSNRSDINRDLSYYGQQTADWLDRSADYVHDLNPQQVKDDVKNQVRSNPGRSLLIAGGIGLLVGAILRRR